MRTVRRRWLAYWMSLLVLGSAVWFPATIMAQVNVGSPFQSSGGGGGAGLGDNNTWTGTNTFQSNNVYGPGTHTFNNDVYVVFGTGGGPGVDFVRRSTNNTPDTTTWAVGTTARSLLLIENGDEAFDFAHAQQTNPTLFIHSANQSTTQWVGLAHDATDAIFSTGVGGLSFVSAGSRSFYGSGTFFDAGPAAAWTRTDAGGINLQDDGQVRWSNSGTVTVTNDVGLERLSAGVVGVTDGSTGNGSFTVPLKASFGDGTTKTVDGATTFAVTSSYHILACTGAETINTITGGTLGMKLVLLSNDTDCTIADDDTPTAANAVNLVGAGVNDVGAVGKYLTFVHDGNAWQQTSESANN